ncbi:MAG TPA: choice-of-anchor J domain-containing protein, partial [Flavobacterium sp.]|uniref:fibronectin type III domain-containing protein n=2 Tax=unclassified Flavobacterium TaxID=196869 RepID=UPI00262224DD
MKRITLLLLLFLLTGTVAYSQVPQNFEGGIPPGWTFYNNAFGAFQWTTVNAVTTPPTVCQGSISAFVNGRENIGAGNTSEKWLVSSLVTVPDNGQLLFSTRSTINGFDNTTYQIRVSTVSQNSGFSIVAQWTEAELNAVFNICEEKEVDLALAGYEGQDIYIAFVMLVTQPTAAPTGDRWIVDDVRLVERCINPENIQVGSISQVGATITWDNPGGADLFEVEIVEFPNTPTGVGVEVGPETTYPATGLNESTQYAVYVRAICSQSNSEWVGPVNFTTSSPGLTCDSAIPVGGLPYSTTDNTANYLDNIDGNPGAGCGAAGNFLNGNDVFYSYTADFDGVVNITMTPTGNNSGLFVYNSCDNVGVSCIAGVSSNNATPRVIDLPVVSGQTYYIVISTSGTPATIAYTLSLQVVNCPPPTNLGAIGGLTSAVLNWDANGATSWEYVLQTVGSTVPAGSGIQTNSFDNVNVTTLFDGTPIAASTQYQYWVRRDCGDGTFSAWAGPYIFNTTTCEPADQCSYIIRTRDTFGDSWNGNIMEVRQNGIVVATITGPTNADGQNPVDFVVQLCTGQPFDLFWSVAGGFTNEVRVQVINDSNQTVYSMEVASGGLAGTVLYTDSLVECGVPECLPPTGLATVAGQISADSAQVEWDVVPGITEYEVIWLPSPSTSPGPDDSGTLTTENPFLITGLDSGTIYNVYIRAICPTGTSNWSTALTFNTTICDIADQCAYIIRTQDTFGDSWNGNIMQVRQNGIVVATITGPTNADGQNPVDFTVQLCDGLPFDLFWSVAGGFTNEVRVQVINDSNQTVYSMDVPSGALAGTVLYTDSLVECGVPECLAPTGLTMVAGQISAESAEVQWDVVPGITEYEVIWLPSPSTVPTATATGTLTTDNPFLITGLESGTLYDVYIRAICPTGIGNWSSALTFNTTICDLADQCAYIIRTRDTFGDSWNGNIMEVRQNGIVVATITGPTNADGQNPVDFTVQLCNGLPFDLFWSVAGGFTGEVRVQVINDSNQTVYSMDVASGGLAGTVLYTDSLVECGVPECLPPTGVSIVTVGQETAEIGWDPIPGFTEFEVIVLPTGSPAPGIDDTGTVTTDNPFEVTSLSPSTTYDVYVRVICSETSISNWTTAFSFNTTQIPVDLNYSEDFEAAHGWSFVNGTSINKWVVGNATNNGGTQAMYISNNNGATNTYTTSPATVVHAYRDLQMPTILNEVNLSFDWRAVGEGFGGFPFDYFRVWLVPVTFTPTPGVQINAASGGQQLGANFNNSASYVNQLYTLPLAAFSDQVLRLVFEWRNDGGGGTQTPAAIDNINVSVLTCPSPSELTASTELGSYSVDLTWTPSGTETQWEVIIQELGSGVPNASSTGIIVNSPTYTFLASEDVFYEFYVRAICSEDDKSFWSGPEQFSIYIPPGCASVDVVGVGVDIVDGSIVVCPDSDIEEINLAASFYGIASTTSYAVESITYEPPFPFTGGTQTSVDTDDVWSDAIDLPFNFCFFGESFTQAKVGSNGVVQFGNGMTDGGGCPWAFTQSVPNPAFPILNAIYGVYQDIDPFINNAFASPNINYQVLGTYPCRALVVNFSQVAQFGTGCNNSAAVGAQTSQIVIYEISNIIEVYVERRVPCTSWQNGVGVIGIQNALGTVGYTPPGRNTGAWSATEEAWRFLPNGESDVDFQWLMNGGFYSNQNDISIVLTPEQQLELETNLTLTLEMEAIATYATCTPGEEVTTSKTVDIVYIIEFPSNDPVDLESCSATGTAIFDLTQNNATILGTFDPALFLITYYLSEEDASVPQNPIENPAEFEGTDGQQIWVRVSDLTNTCSLVKSFFLNFGDDIVTPIVEFEYDPAVICVSSTSGLLLPTLATDFNIGGVFTSTTGLVIDPTTGEINLGTSTAGIYEVVYTLEAQGCTEGGTYTFTIELVNAVTPITEFSYDEAEYCKSGSNPVLVPAENFDITGQFTATPAGLTIDASTGAIDLSTSTAGVYEITYLVSSNTGVCEINESHTVTLTVIDVVDPVFDPITTTYCIDATADVLLTTSTNGITGTWSPATIDTTVAVVDAEYIFTPDAGQCANIVTWLITVTEEVTPTFDPIATAYCLNATPDALPASTNGITGTWSPSAIDTSVAVVDAEYVFTPDAGQCAVPVTILVTITSEILPTFDPISVCQGSASP